ncbi:unnamed protein product [Calypogeia fissa]
MANPILKKYGDKAPYMILDNEPPRSDNTVVQVFPSKKKKPGSRVWMRFDSSGVSEFLELDRNAIMQRASIPARDLRILGPVFSQSSHILARERAMVVNLEFIKAIVTAEELFLLDATTPAVVPFVEQLKEQFPLKSSSQDEEQQQAGRSSPEDDQESVNVTILEAPAPDAMVEWSPKGNLAEEPSDELPFELRVLEIALDVVCNSLEGRVNELELKAYPTLDEFTKNITSGNLELVRSLKSLLTRLTVRVQKVRDELEQLLDDDDDMADLYLTRKLAQEHHVDSPSVSFRLNGGPYTALESNKASIFNGATSMAASVSLGNEDVEDLEMLLEAYFMQLDGTLNKLMMIREYIDDTEDYINIQLDHKRNQLFQFQITLTTSMLAIGIGTACCGAVSMNIQIPVYSNNEVFLPFIMSMLTVTVSVFTSVVMYIHWKGLFQK